MRIGPAGNSRRFYSEGFKRSEQAPAWLRAQGLDAFEYPMGRGVHLGEDTARAIGAEALKNDVLMSVHAPYFINCASGEAEMRERSIGYLLESARAAQWMGAERIVFHVGSPGRLPRAEAFQLAQETIARAREALDAAGFFGIALCPETMGRISQFGTLDEILSLCKTEARLIPALDFGHLHVIGLGALNTEGDFRAVLEKLVGALGYDRANRFHAHFSRINFGPKGEKRHMNFSDSGYGPDFRLLAPALLELNLDPVIICESAGDQADDALSMLDAVREFKARRAAARDCERDADMV